MTPLPRAWHNRFFIMRHGESEANRQGLIVSTPEHGIPAYGLSQQGQAQVRDSISQETRLNADTLIYSSDFKRAWETAQIVHTHLGCQAALVSHPALRERCFGELEGQDHRHYSQIWEADAQDPNHSHHGVESANAVMARVSCLVADLEQRWQARRILLVAHGDVLQILQTAVTGQPASAHRSLPHLHTAEIRDLASTHQ